jgi:hypothetical protein
MLFIDLASLVFDPHFAVASAARGLLVDLMRNEPSLVTRPVLDLLADPHKGMPAAISALRAFLHVRDGLPFGMAHFVLNSLAGYLKFSARQVESAGDTLRGFAHTVPILSKLVTQVTAMSILEMRRAKVEIFLVPSGPLWFAPSAPSGPMFPRNLGTPHVDGTEPVPPALVGIVMIRLAQNMTFLSMLKRKPQDVNIIRKSMSRFALPSRDPYANDTMPLQLAEFAPRKLVDGRVDPFRLDRALRGLSLMLSRSYLLLLAQVFRSMSRHLNDRNEFVGLVYGLNKILLAHGDDISIVSQAMIGEWARLCFRPMSKRIEGVPCSLDGCKHAVPALVHVERGVQAVHARRPQSVRRVDISRGDQTRNRIRRQPLLRATRGIVPVSDIRRHRARHDAAPCGRRLDGEERVRSLFCGSAGDRAYHPGHCRDSQRK